jgi:hypothetical protein
MTKAHPLPASSPLTRVPADERIAAWVPATVRRSVNSTGDRDADMLVNLSLALRALQKREASILRRQEQAKTNAKGSTRVLAKAEVKRAQALTDVRLQIEMATFVLATAGKAARSATARTRLIEGITVALYLASRPLTPKEVLAQLQANEAIPDNVADPLRSVEALLTTVGRFVKSGRTRYTLALPR